MTRLERTHVHVIVCHMGVPMGALQHVNLGNTSCKVSLGNAMCKAFHYSHADVMTLETVSASLAICEGKPPVTAAVTTGPLWGNPPVPGGFSSQKASHVECCCFLFCQSQQTVESAVKLMVIWDTMILMWCHCDWDCLGKVKKILCNI